MRGLNGIGLQTLSSLINPVPGSGPRRAAASLPPPPAAGVRGAAGKAEPRNRAEPGQTGPSPQMPGRHGQSQAGGGVRDRRGRGSRGLFQDGILGREGGGRVPGEDGGLEEGAGAGQAPLQAAATTFRRSQGPAEWRPRPALCHFAPSFQTCHRCPESSKPRKRKFPLEDPHLWRTISKFPSPQSLHARFWGLGRDPAVPGSLGRARRELGSAVPLPASGLAPVAGPGCALLGEGWQEAGGRSPSRVRG